MSVDVWPVGWMSHPEVLCYFAVLFWSFLYCFSRCKSIWRVIMSLAAMSVTWYYILTWTIKYKLDGGGDLFDDAYRDVLEGSHGFISSQLLSWVVVGAIWIRRESVHYMLLGMLAAMSSAFLVLNPSTIPINLSSTNRAKSLLSPFREIRSIPFSFILSSLISLYSIHKLLEVGSKDFSFWLKGLHIFLVAPQIVSRIIPVQITVDKSAVFGLLGVLICALHFKNLKAAHNISDNGSSNTYYDTINAFYNDLLSKYATPYNNWESVSHCNKSITYDLILCSLFTLHTIYSQSSSIAAAAIAAAMMPILSPGAVFSFYLAIYDEERSSFRSLHNRFVTYLQKSVARKLRSSNSSSNSNSSCCGKSKYMWMNLGMGWHKGKTKTNSTYDDACQNLASILGDAAFNEYDSVLACGCGYGAELVFWKNEYKLAHITGIDVNEEAANSFIHEDNVRLMCSDVSDIVPNFKGIVDFNKIVSLDSIYHFDNKSKFFQDCFSMLSVSLSPQSMLKSRSICVTDIAIVDDLGSIPFLLRCMLSFMNVSVTSLWSISQYKKNLEALGYVDVKVKSLNKDHHIIDGWFNQAICKYLDYVIVEAFCPMSSVIYVKRPSAAVIGTGLSGLVTANLLAKTHDVTIYEANGKCGLAGHGYEVFGEIVDVPLRIIGEGYYCFAQNFIESVNVSLSPIRKDFLTQSNIGDNAPSGSPSVFCYTNNFFYNMFSILPHFLDVYRFNRIVYNNGKSGADLDWHNSGTWGEWLTQHEYNVDKYRSNKAISSKSNDGGGRDSYIIWLLMGEFSWMLSCTYDQVLDYPASVILTFAVSLGWGKSVFETIGASSRSAGRMLRVKPSMKVLEFALTYGLQVNLNTRIKALDENRVIDGKSFDCIVVATEASAIKHILKPNIYPQVFSRIEYQPSSIVLHKDPSFMPTEKKNWLAFNVLQTQGEGMCQLTAWLNEYYPDAKFPCNLFQTWNPHRKPDPASVISESHFLRVVHTRETPSILTDITKAQGKFGIYYCGAYAVEGMGLLEQAAVSGQRVADLIIAHASASSAAKYKMKDLDSILSDLGHAKSQLASMMPRYGKAVDKGDDKKVFVDSNAVSASAIKSATKAVVEAQENDVAKSAKMIKKPVAAASRKSPSRNSKK